MEQIIIVDKNGKEIGLEEREKCHFGEGILHKAITILIFNKKGELLITRRSKSKKLWPKIWETSCSTHVHENEEPVKCGEKRLKEELGFTCKLETLSKFRYKEKFKNIGCENEVCSLLVGEHNGKIIKNQLEVEEHKWINLEKLRKDIQKKPDAYAPWLKIALNTYLKNIEGGKTREDYFKKMKETSKLSERYLTNILKNKIKDKNIEEDLFYFLKKRENKIWHRPWMVRMGYEFGGGRNWKRIIKLGAILELENISNYQINAAIDKKYGINDDPSRMKQFLVAFISRNIVQELIEKNFSNGLATDISTIIQEIDNHNQNGQLYEFIKLYIKNFNSNIEFEDYLKDYLKRCFYYGGIWIKNCLFSGYLLSGKNNKRALNTLKEFGTYLGTGWMILNDITDYYIDAKKHKMNYKGSTDELKDIWNGKVTLPIFHSIKFGSNKEREFLLKVLNNKINKNKKNMKKVLEILTKNGSLNFAYSIANYFRKRAKKIIKKFPLRKRYNLSILADSVKCNKFIHEYRKKGLKVIKLRKRMKEFLKSEAYIDSTFL